MTFSYTTKIAKTFLHFLARVYYLSSNNGYYDRFPIICGVKSLFGLAVFLFV
jgi:hypothetical protein